MDIQILNIPESQKLNLQKWAEITVEKWKFSIGKEEVIDSGKLFNSFAYTVSNDAKGNTALISFAFEYYLRMLEMGVGKGVTYENRKYSRSQEGRDNKYKVRRKSHKGLYSKVLYSEVMRLGELLTYQYAVAGATVIIDDFKHSSNQKTTI